MSRVPMWRRYLRFFGPDVEADVRDELRFHIETKSSELMDRGLSAEEARHEALRSFGDLGEVKNLCRTIGEEHVRNARRENRMANWWYDISHAFRSLMRAPRFSLVAVFTLAGALLGTASLFSLVDAWIIRSVRFPEPHQLIFAKGLETRQAREIGVSFADYADTAARTRLLKSLSAWTEDSFTLSLEGPAERVSGARVSTNLFETLAVQPMLGRAFLPHEGEFGRHHVAVVSYGFWKARLRGDPSAIGSTLNINRQPYVVVGVMPESFHFTLVGRANVWLPLSPSPEERSQRGARFLQMVGRLKPDVTVAQAHEEFHAIAAQLAAAYPGTNREIGALVMGLNEEIGRHTGRNVLLIVFGVTLGLLLVGCSNIGSLLMVRALARQRQAAIQLAVGASGWRIIRQGLTETLTLFIVASLLGAAAASWANKVITDLIPFENRGYLPDYGQAPVNWTAFGLVLLIALVTGIAFGLVPAMEASRTDLTAVLKECASAVSQSIRSRRIRLTLVVGQVFIATILASATIVLVESFRKVLDEPLGFDGSQVLTFRVSLDEHQYATPAQRRAFFDSVVSRLESPQFGKPAVATTIPFSDSQTESSFRLPTLDGPSLQDSARLPRAVFNVVGPEYFSALRIPLRAGRLFENGDSQDARLVAIVNERFVLQYLAGRNAVGEPVVLGKVGNRLATIVGVVGATRENSDPGPVSAQIYVPFPQAPEGDAFVISRMAGDPLKFVPDARRIVARLDPSQPLYDAKTFGERLDETFVPFRIIGGLLIWFGGLAVGLAGVGIYGVIAFSVSQRTREIGIRAVLGAGRHQLQMLFLRQGMLILVAGLIPGLLCGFAVCTVLRSVLADMIAVQIFAALLFTAALITSVVVLATSLPARRAGTVNPVMAIRYE